MGGVTSNLSTWVKKEERNLDRAEEKMARTILNRAKMLAPKLTGALIENGRIEKNPNGGRTIIFGDSSVPYARRRHFENRKNPQTLHYLQRAGDSVAKENVKKYVDK